MLCADEETDSQQTWKPILSVLEIIFREVID